MSDDVVKRLRRRDLLEIIDKINDDRYQSDREVFLEDMTDSDRRTLRYEWEEKERG